MSASNKKKLRKEEQTEQLTQRQLQERKEAKKLKTNTAIFVTVISLILALGIGLIVYNWVNNSGLPEKMTTAVEINGDKISQAELSYFYMDYIYQLQNTNLTQMYMFQFNDGFDPYTALDQQQYKDDPDKTWGDYFVEMAIENATFVYAMCDEAAANNYQLSTEEIAQIDENLNTLKADCVEQGFGSFKDYLKAAYGNGATEKTYRAYVEKCTLASSYYNYYLTLEQTFSDKQKDDFITENGPFSSYKYVFFEVDPEHFMEHEEDSSSHDHSVKEKELALSLAKDAADALIASGAKDKESLDAAIAALDAYKPEVPAEDENETNDSTEGGEEIDAPADGSEDTAASADSSVETDTPADSSEDTDASADSSEDTAASADSSVETDTPANSSEETDATADGSEETDAPADGSEDADIPAEEEPTDEEEPEEYTSSEQTILYEYLLYYDTHITEWLQAEGRTPGEIDLITVYETDDTGAETTVVETYYVIIFLEELTHEENMVNIRHILVNFESASGSDDYTEEEMQAARDEMDNIKAEWEKTDMSETAFAELAKTYSDDNAEEGGLYENVYRGQMVDTFDEWCFDESRNSGDWGVVETEYGVHLIYFIEEQDQSYRNALITSGLTSEAQENWYNTIMDRYKATIKIKNTKNLRTDFALMSAS